MNSLGGYRNHIYRVHNQTHYYCAPTTSTIVSILIAKKCFNVVSRNSRGQSRVKVKDSFCPILEILRVEGGKTKHGLLKLLPKKTMKIPQ